MNLGIIVARGGSKGFPGKNIHPLAGKPLIVHTIQAAQHSRLLDAFLVSTDDQAIAQIAKAVGASVPFMRPPELVTDEVPIWPTLLHATEYWEKATGRRAETVVMLQPTTPLRTGEDIDGCIAQFGSTKADICVSVSKAHDSPYFNMVEPIPGYPDRLRPCTDFMRKHSRRQDAPPVYALNGGVYVLRRSLFPGLESQFQVDSYAVYEMPRSRSVDIDDPEDMALAEWLLSRSKS